MNTVNPFDGYGVHATGQRFVGRIQEVQQLTRSLRGLAGGISVSGLARVGKTSLVMRVFQSPHVLPEGTCRATICASTQSSALSLYWSVLTELVRDAGERGAPLPSDAIKAVESFPTSLVDAFRSFKSALRAWKAAGVRTSVVIDEFDGVLEFEAREAHLLIQGLRELLDHQDSTGFHCILISRRSLYHIERQTPSISNLANLCKLLPLKMLPEAELGEMVDRAAPGWILTEDMKKRLWELTGGFPYIAEMILGEGFEEQSVDVGYEKARGAVLVHFDKIRILLEEDGLWGPLLQATAAHASKPPLLEATQRLRDYGIIRPSSLSPVRSPCRVFSESFQIYMESVARTRPFSDLWREAEHQLRRYIGRTLSNHYGANWVDSLRDKHKPFSALLRTNWEPKRDKETRVFGQDASTDILEYSYPSELWQLICWEWTLFKPVFRDREYWSERFATMAKVRTPDFHSRAVPDGPLAKASEYCTELLALVDES